jgi:hypothetical protein
MKRALKIVLIVTVILLGLGCICFGLSLFLGSDLTRIADVVFSRYDLTQTLINVQNLILRIKGLF